MHNESWQWSCALVVYHGPGFGHRMEVITLKKGSDPHKRYAGSWNSLGIPELVLNEARTVVDSAITDHLVSRYGVQGELPTVWAGEPDPF